MTRLPGGSMSHSTKRVLSLLGASAAILSALTVSPLLANDLFYTISEGGSDLIEINVRSVGTTTTTLIGPTSGGVLHYIGAVTLGDPLQHVRAPFRDPAPCDHRSGNRTRNRFRHGRQ